MKKVILVIGIAVLFAGCSFKVIEHATIETCNNCPIDTNIDNK